MIQPGKVANPARGQLNRETLIFLFFRSRLRIWSRETGSALPSRVSLLISVFIQAEHIIYMVLTHGIPPEFRCGVDSFFETAIPHHRRRSLHFHRERSQSVVIASKIAKNHVIPYLRIYPLSHEHTVICRNSMIQPGKVANPARGQLNRETLIFLFFRSRLRIWSRETGSALLSRVSLLISVFIQAEHIIYMVLTHGIPPEFRCGVDSFF